MLRLVGARHFNEIVLKGADCTMQGTRSTVRTLVTIVVGGSSMSRPFGSIVLALTLVLGVQMAMAEEWWVEAEDFDSLTGPTYGSG